MTDAERYLGVGVCLEGVVKKGPVIWLPIPKDYLNL